MLKFPEIKRRTVALKIPGIEAKGGRRIPPGIRRELGGEVKRITWTLVDLRK